MLSKCLTYFNLNLKRCSILVAAMIDQRYHSLGFVPRSGDRDPYFGILRFGADPSDWARTYHLCYFPRISGHYFPSENTRQQPTDVVNHKEPHPKQTGCENMRTKEKVCWLKYEPSRTAIAGAVVDGPCR